MQRKETVEREYLACDGCDYVLGLTARERADGVKVESQMTVLEIPMEGERLAFHFHGPGSGRHDCFRYWAHSPRIMRRSLEARDFNEAAVDEFMSVHLYREHSHSPGIERPKATA